MRNNVPCFLTTLLPADAQCDTASVHSLLCMSHSAACWTPFSAEINCAGLIRGSGKVSPAGRQNRFNLDSAQIKTTRNTFSFFSPPQILIYIPPQLLAGHICLPNAEQRLCVILLLRQNGTRIPPTPPQSGPLQKLPAKLIYAVPPFRPPSVTGRKSLAESAPWGVARKAKVEGVVCRVLLLGPERHLWIIKSEGLSIEHRTISLGAKGILFRNTLRSLRPRQRFLWLNEPEWFK